MPRHNLSGTRSYLAAPIRSVIEVAIEEIPWLRDIRITRRLRRKMRSALGYDPNLKQPRTFNERIAWKILHDRNPLIPLTLDKVAVRDWVADRIGKQYLVPVLGVWQQASQIFWDNLPDRFVEKTNHGSGYNMLVPNKSKVDHDEVRQQLDKWLNECYFQSTGEWEYKDIPRRILIEEYLQGTSSDVPEDYKIYVFGGRPRLLKMHVGRFTDRWRSFFHDPKSLEPVNLGPLHHADHPDYSGPPREAAALYALAATLGADFDAVRVDFYIVNGRPFFSELTHYSGGATVSLGSYEHDLIMGEMWGEAVQSPRQPPLGYGDWMKRPRSATAP